MSPRISPNGAWNADWGYLRLVIAEAHRAIGLTGCRTLEDFQEDGECHYAVVEAVRAIAAVGGQLSDDFRESHPDVPWTRILNTRERSVDDLPLREVWRLVHNDLPDLILTLEPLLAPMQQEL